MNNKSNYKITIIIVLSLFLILVSNSFTITNAQTLNNKPLKIWLTLQVPNYLAYIAQGKDYFKNNNVDVNLTLIKNYGDAINGYSTGIFDGIFIVYSDALNQQSSGADTKVVYNLDSSFKADVIVGKGNNLSDVKGKKIGVEEINSFSHFFVLKPLEKAGLTEGDIEFVNIPIQNVSSAVQKGEIYSGHTYEAFISNSLKNGFKILSTGATMQGIITNVIAFHLDIVQQRPQDIQNLVKSMIEAKQDFDRTMRKMYQ